MRLIGGHDYYDGAGMGVDTGVVFVRDGAHRLADLPDVTDHPFRVPEPIAYRGGAWSSQLIPTLILIGGDHVPVLEERVTEDFRTESRFHYALEEAQEAVRAGRDRHTARFGLWRSKSFPDELRAFFERDLRKDETAWLIDNHVTVLSTWRPPFWNGRRAPAQVNHACLKELELYRKLDPATAHMRISAFVSGVLPFDRQTVEISDKDRIRKAGFDLESSFRRPKGRKKRARQG